MLVYFEVMGFVPPSRRPKLVKPASFGRRPGMASPAQIALIREMWAEWSGAHDEDALIPSPVKADPRVVFVCESS